MNFESTLILINRILRQMYSGESTIGNPEFSVSAISEAEQQVLDSLFSVNNKLSFLESENLALKRQIKLLQSEQVSSVKYDTDIEKLIKQINLISLGDYSQKITFLPEISVAIEKMVSSLKEKQSTDDLIKDNEQLFRTMFDTSADTMVISDLQGVVLHLSKSGKEMFGVSDLMLGRGLNLFDFVVDEDRERALYLVGELLKGNPSGFAEYRVMKASGEVFWVESNANIIYDSHGAPKGFFMMTRDVTKRKIDEVALAEATDRLRDLISIKDKFFSIIAHDVKNPFHLIISQSEILVNEYDELSDSEHKRFARNINKASQQIYKLFSNLLTWSMSQTGILTFNPEVIQIEELVKMSLPLLNSLAQKKGISLNVELPADCEITVDVNMVSTIIRNLITNAVKFTPAGGIITVTASISDGMCNLVVADTGVGLTSKDISLLFRIDVKNSEIGSSEEKGTGLGLILCKEFVELHGGRICAEHNEPNGAKFSITLPLAL